MKKNRKKLVENQEFSKNTVNWSNRASMFRHVFDNMLAYKGDMITLTGGTGIGKTTFIKDLSRILGLELLVIEVPHVSIEQVINIPYLKFKDNKKTASGTMVADKMNVVMAKSHLVDLCNNLQKKTDQQWQKDMASWPEDIQAVYNTFSEKTKGNIIAIRRRFSGILFLDEYYRTVEVEVRNVLRDILEHKIGQDMLPEDVYIITASNMKDVGGTVETPQGAAKHRPLEYQPPTKNEFWYYLLSRGSKIKKEVVDVFYPIIQDEYLNWDDDSEIRTSSRRWEQVLRYISSSIPVKSTEDANNLLGSVKTMFKDDEKTSTLWTLVRPVLENLIKQTSEVKLGTLDPTPPTDWEKILEHQIEQKIALGKNRSYIPIIYGRPGVGKTSAILHAAREFNLVPVKINSQGLKSTDIIGLPLPQSGKTQSEQSTEFSEPPLRRLIIKQVMKEFNTWKKSASREDRQAWLKQHYKFLLFFDEINRVQTQNTFNVLRRLILEKEFNDRYKLWSSMIIVAAMNPKKYGDPVHELSTHLKDSADLIEASPNYDKLQSHLDALNKTEYKNYSDDVKEMAKQILTGFVEEFAHKLPNANADENEKVHHKSLPFFLKLSSKSSEMTPEDSEYLSPRDYDDLYKYLIVGIDSEIEESAGEEPDEVARKLSDYLYTKFKSVIGALYDKNPELTQDFMTDIKKWLHDNMTSFMSNVGKKAELKYMLPNILKDSDYHLADDPNWTKYMENYHPNTFHTELSAFFNELATTVESKHHLIGKNTHPVKEKSNEGIQATNELYSAVEAIVWDLHNAISDKYSAEPLEIVLKVLREFMHTAMNDIADQEHGTAEHDKLVSYINNNIMPRVINLLSKLKG